MVGRYVLVVTCTQGAFLFWKHKYMDDRHQVMTSYRCHVESVHVYTCMSEISTRDKKRVKMKTCGGLPSVHKNVSRFQVSCLMLVYIYMVKIEEQGQTGFSCS